MRTDEKIKTLTEQSAKWRLASLLMSRPQQTSFQEIQAISNELPIPQLKQIAASAINNATEQDYLKCFGPSGSISPREVAYSGYEDPGLVMSDLFHFYHSFHYTPRAEDPDDHISVETGFIAYLLLKEAYAHATDQLEEADLTATALGHFQEKHLCRLIHGMANRFTGAEPDYLQQMMKHLLDSIQHITVEPVKKSFEETSDSFNCPFNGGLCDES